MPLQIYMHVLLLNHFFQYVSKKFITINFFHFGKNSRNIFSPKVPFISKSIV